MKPFHHSMKCTKHKGGSLIYVDRVKKNLFQIYSRPLYVSTSAFNHQMALLRVY